MFATAALSFPFQAIAKTLENIKLQTAKNEIELLKVQISIMEKYNAEILNTVYFSIGMFVSIALVIIGFNWFSNDRDKKAFKDELRASMDIERKQIENRIEAFEVNIKSTLTSLAEENKKVLLKESNKKITELKEDFDFEIFLLKSRQLESEREDWLKSGDYSNAYRCSLKKLDLCTSMPSYIVYHLTPMALDDLLLDLRRVEKSNFDLGSSLVSETESALQKLNGEHLTIRNEILNLLSEVTKGA